MRDSKRPTAFASKGGTRSDGRSSSWRPAAAAQRSTCRATTACCATSAPESIVEALVGVSLAPGELRSLVSGCGFGVAEPAGGREYSGGYVAVDTGGPTTYLRREQNVWRVAAATRPPLTVLYSGFVNGRPATLRVVSSGTPRADLTVRLSDVNINVPMDAAVFAVDVPAAAQPLTLDELRRAGPLGGE